MQFKIPKINLDEEPSFRERMFFGIAIVGIFFMFYNSILSPRIQKIRSTKQELKNAQLQAGAVKMLIDATRQQLAKRVSDVSALSPLMDDKVKRILERKVLDPTDEINNTVSLLGRLAGVKRVKVKTLTTGDRIEKSGYITVPITAELMGTYTGVEGYMDAIENLELPIAVDSFKLQSEVKEGVGTLSTVLNLELYIAKR